MSQIQAVTIIIQKDGKFLLGKRSPWKKAAPGYWCPVSGKIEPGESEIEAVCREAWEEVGLKVETVKKLTAMDTRDGSGRLHFWLVKILEGEAYLKNDEHTELGWFSLDEIRLLDPTFHEDLAILSSLT
jgi:8-oxo-dGTP diphosphatase